MGQFSNQISAKGREIQNFKNISNENGLKISEFILVLTFLYGFSEQSVVAYWKPLLTFLAFNCKGGNLLTFKLNLKAVQ